MRELTRRHQTRWLSEDMSGEVDADDASGGRRQTTRGGSAESPLGNLAGSGGEEFSWGGLEGCGYQDEERGRCI